MDADLAGTIVDQTKFRGLNGSFLYLTSSKPDFKAANQISKYLKGTISVGLWYPSHSPIHLVGYFDSNFSGCKLDRKSISGTCHLLGSSLISWHSKKQACVALSTAEVEYIVASSCCAQILWIKQQLEDFRLKVSNMPLFSDNTSAINLTKNQIQHSKTKHIEICHHFIRDHVSNGDCEI